MNKIVISYRKHATASDNLRLDAKFFEPTYRKRAVPTNQLSGLRRGKIIDGRECPLVISV
jgi:hypothetical protein